MRQVFGERLCLIRVHLRKRCCQFFQGMFGERKRERETLVGERERERFWGLNLKCPIPVMW